MGVLALDPLTLLARLTVVFAALVIVPLALPLVGRADRRNGRPGTSGVEVRSPMPSFVVLAAGTLLVVALALPAGASALLVVPWCVVTAWLALWGVRRFASRARFRLEELAIDVGLVHLPIGAAWLFAYRADLAVLGFSGTQALLTANHFHVAGFGACVVAGLTGRAIRDRLGWLRRVWRVAAVVTTAGVLTLAIGITVSRALETASALALSVAVSLVGIVLIALAFSHAAAGRTAAVRTLLALSGIATLHAMHHAARFALVGFARLDDALFRRMVLEHGVVNTVGFVGLALVGFRLAGVPSRSSALGIPMSRLAARGRVGPRFFETSGLTDTNPERTPRGLTDAFTELSREDFDAASTAPRVRDFYERTAEHWLVVRADWSPAFRWAGLLWHALASRLGQLAIPIRDGRAPGAVTSRIVPLRDDRDGRSSVRAWIRTYRSASGGEGDVIYVAAYSTHQDRGVVYMNIAFPLPLSNMTSVLHVSPLGRCGGVRLTTRREEPAPSSPDGDEGVWLATALGTMRLPLDETIDVWDAASDVGWEERLSPPTSVPPSSCTVLATHDMWMFGMRYVRLTYFIGRDRAV